MSWFKSRYTRLLEDRVVELGLEVSRIREERDALLASLLEKAPRPASITAADILAKKRTHRITNTTEAAKCSCGWEERCNDPAKLQELVIQHANQNSPVRGATRKPWPQIKAQLEGA